MGALSHRLAALMARFNPEPALCATKAESRDQSPDLLDEVGLAHSAVLEHALRISLSTLRERIRMRQRLAQGFAERGHLGLSENFERQAEAARAEEGLISQVLGRVLELRAASH
jgi:hypothetical protein